MPTYNVTDPTSGKSMRLTGDSPPSEEELDQIFSSVGGVKEPTTIPRSTGQRIAGAIAPYARPALEVGGSIAGGTLGAGAGPLGAVAGTGLGYAGGRQAASALEEYAGLKQPSTLPQAAKQAVMDVPSGMTMEMGGQLAGKGLQKGIEYAGKGLKQVLGTTTGSGPGMIEEAVKGKPEFMQAARGKIPGEEVVSNVKDALQVVRENRGIAYRTELEKISPIKSLIDKRPIDTKLSELIKNYGYKFNQEGELESIYTAGGIGKKAEKDITDIVSTVKAWGQKQGDMTPSGMDTLKRYLDDFYSESSRARQFVASLRNTVKDQIVKEVPEYAKMTKDYAEVSSLIKDIEKGLMAGNKTTADQTLRRLTSSMRESFEMRKALLDILSNKSGEDLTAQVAGYSASQAIPRGLFGKVAAGSEVFFLKNINPVYWPLLATSSPRAVAEFLNVYGKALRATSGATQAVGKAAAFGAVRKDPEDEK